MKLVRVPYAPLEHHWVLYVYGPGDALICWCGPSKVTQHLDDIDLFRANGWLKVEFGSHDVRTGIEGTTP